jgi:penicillin-binding protein 1A
MRKVLVWSIRVLGALFLLAFLFVAAVAGRVYWLASDGLPDHRLVDGASSWNGCLRTEDRQVEFVPLSAMPANAVNAFLAAEEPDFLTRDAYLTWRFWGPEDRRTSPISAAYVHRLLFCLNNPSHDLTIEDIKEYLLHYRIERDLPRRSILEVVLNTVYVGKGAFGMPAAALAYFQKPLTELSTGELAFLAGWAAAKHKWKPEGAAVNEVALLVRNATLDRMAGMGALTAEQAAAAKLEPLNLQVKLEL